MEIKFTVNAVRWFDKVNGNTYHSVRITRNSDGKVLVSAPECYGYGDHYRQTAMMLMIDNNWIPEQYTEKNYYMYERENNYPIAWNVSDGLKRDMKNNVLI